MGWLEDWWEGRAGELAQVRARDPGVPAYPFTAVGERVNFPVSYVVAALGERYRPLFNLDQLRRSTLEALAGKPDTRTHAQRRSDDWEAYQARVAEEEERERAKEAKRCGLAQVQEAVEEAQGEAPGTRASASPGPTGSAVEPARR